MKRCVIVLLLVTILTPAVFADGWWADYLYRRSPENDTLRGADRNDNVAVAVGDNGYLAASWNSGVTFTSLNRSTSSTLFCVSLVSTTTGYAGGSGVLLKTTNINNWSEINRPGEFNNIRGVDFLDANNGWVCGGSYISRTTDGGSSWNSQSFSGGYEFYDIHMYSSGYGLAVDTGGRIFRWNGSAWSQVEDVGPGLRSVYILDADYAWAVGDQGAIYATTNGGTDWGSRSSGVTSTLNAVGAVSDGGRYVYACGNDDVVLYSTDGGDSWSAFGNHFFYNDLYALTPPVNADTVNAVGELGAILFTNSGVSWTMVVRAGNRLNAVACAEPNHPYVLAVGENGYNLASGNDGYSWLFRAAAGSRDLNDLDYIDDDRFVACGANGTVLYTEDTGINWSDASGNLPAKNLYSIDVLDADTWFVCGADLSIYYTTNGGSSWTTDNTGTPGLNFYGVSMLDQNTGWAVGDVVGGYAVVYRKSSGTWNRFSTGLSSATSPLLDVDVWSTSEGVCCGEDGLAYYLYSGGSQWRKVNGLGSEDINALDFMNDTEGWMVADNGVIYHSTNGGVSYSTDDNRAADDNLDLYGVFFHDDGGGGWGWACGDFNARLVYGDFTPVRDGELTATHHAEGCLLSWTVTSGESAACELERRRDDGPWLPLTTEPLSGERTRYLDRQPQPGETCEYRLRVTLADGERLTLGPVEYRRPAAAESFTLRPAYPNPLSCGATLQLEFELAEAADVRLAVYDLAGRRLALLVDGPLAAGRHTTNWSTVGNAPGLYLLRLEAAGRTAVERVVLRR